MNTSITETIDIAIGRLTNLKTKYQSRRNAADNGIRLYLVLVALAEVENMLTPEENDLKKEFNKTVKTGAR